MSESATRDAGWERNDGGGVVCMWLDDIWRIGGVRGRVIWRRSIDNAV